MIAVGMTVRMRMSMGMAVFGYLGVRIDQLRQRVDRAREIAVVLHHDVGRLGEHLGGQLLGTEHRQRARPVDGLGDARRLAQIQIAQTAHDLDELGRQRLRESGVLGFDDLQFALRVGIIQRQV